MTRKKNKQGSLAKVVFRFMTSYGLVVVVLVLMMVLTLFGTLEQTHRGINDVVETYFNSAFVVHWIGGVPIPLPGGYFLMVMLFINLLCGAIIKARKDWRHPGMLIAHGGILLLLLGGMVSTHFSIRGYMQIFEGGMSNEFVSFYEWQVEIVEVGEDGMLKERALVVPPSDLSSIRQDEQRVFTAEELPFDFIVNGYAVNSRPMRSDATVKEAPRVVDGFALHPLELEKEEETNLPGMYAAFRGGDLKEEVEAILWGGAFDPFTLEVGERKFAVSVTKKKWTTPFDVRLDEFVAVYHPGSEIPAKFESYITKIEGEVEEPVKIWMNHPLRHDGYTLFQRSFGSKEGDPRTGHQYSVFDVVKNPADQWPLYSLTIVGVGLLIHFLQKLASYLKKALAKEVAVA